MLSIRRSAVPVYLHESAFYLSLNPEDDEEINIPENSCKPNDSVTNEESMRHLLTTLRFWGATHIVLGLFNSAINQMHTFFESVANDYQKELTYLSSLLKLRFANRTNLPFMITAAREGNVVLIQFLLSYGCAQDTTVTQAAAGAGHLKLLQYLHSIGCEWDEATCNAAAQGGHFECLHFAYSHGCPWQQQFMWHCVAPDSLPCIKYISDNGCPLDSDLFNRIAERDAIDCMEYVFNNGHQFPHDLVQRAVMHNGLRCLAFALAKGCTFSDSVLTGVRSVQCLQILYHSDHEWTAQSTAQAAYNYTGVFILQFLHENGCPWDESTFFHAVLRVLRHSTSSEPDLTCLKYAHQHGCPWSREVSMRAIKYDNLPAVEYLHAHGCPFDTEHTALAASNPSILTFLHTSGVPWDESTAIAAARMGSLQCLRYAITNNCPIPEDICKYTNHPELVGFLLSIGYQRYTPEETGLPEDEEDDIFWG